MPVFNAGLYLEECIKSVLRQSLANFEFLIINDGSTDNSLKIIKKFQKIDDRIICITRENKGLIYSLNEGINLSKGAYIARMDADDVCYPERLEEQYDFMKKNHLDICGGDYQVICEKGLPIKNLIVPKKESEILLSLASNVPFAHPSVMIKKEFLSSNNLRYGIFGHKYAEDLDLWVRMYQAGAKFGNLSIPLIKYRHVNNSSSRINYIPMKWETTKTYNSFVYNNLAKFKATLYQFCTQKPEIKVREKEATRALLRYLSFKFDFKLLLNFLKIVSLKNFIVGVLSYINSKLIIKWIK